jgi:hypothetical protein
MRGGRRAGAGRRPIFDKTHLAQIRVNQAIWDAIPAPKAAWVREAIEEKAKKENLTTASTRLTTFAS